MIDLFSLLPQDESVRLGQDFYRIYALPAYSSEYHEAKSLLSWLDREYHARWLTERQRKRDVLQYRDVMARSLPRLRD